MWERLSACMAAQLRSSFVAPPLLLLLLLLRLGGASWRRGGRLRGGAGQLRRALDGIVVQHL